MSCSGCRVLRKGCGESCILRPCLQWIETAEAQGNATVFVAKFFGRAGLMAFISSVPEFHRPALFQSLLFEACGRTINPVSGAVGLLWTRHWDLCQVAVDTVLRGGMIGPIKEIGGEEGDLAICSDESMDSYGLVGDLRSPALNSGESGNISDDEMCLNREKRLLNLFI